jgi:hypothetical protein
MTDCIVDKLEQYGNILKIYSSNISLVDSVTIDTRTW